MDDRERVAAVLRGDPAGLADCYETYADRLYTFCHAMLRDDASAQDAVQDTFVVLAQRVGQLRDADRLRPWLYSVARSNCLHQLRSRRRSAPTDDVPDVTDDAVSAADEVESAELRTLVWDAAGGLNAGERAALELSLRHGLEGDDLAAALGVPRATSTKLLQRGRDQLERGLGALLLARDATTGCAELGSLTSGWDGTLTVLMRKRLGRHIDGCATCSTHRKRTVTASRVLRGTPLLIAPVALREKVLEPHALVGFDTALPAAAASAAARGAVGRLRFDRAGFPTERPEDRRWVLLAISAVVALAVSLSIVVVAIGRPAGDATGRLSYGAVAPETLSLAPAPTTAGSASATPRDTVGEGGPEIEPGRSVTASTTTTAPSMSHPATHPATPSRTPSRPASTTPVRTAPSTPRSTPPTTPTTPAQVLTVTPQKLDFGTDSRGTVTLSASYGSIAWTATAPAGVVVDPASGTVTAGTDQQVIIGIIRRAQPVAPATVTFSYSGGSVTVVVEWT